MKGVVICGLIIMIVIFHFAIKQTEKYDPVKSQFDKITGEHIATRLIIKYELPNPESYRHINTFFVYYNEIVKIRTVFLYTGLAGEKQGCCESEFTRNGVHLNHKIIL